MEFVESIKDDYFKSSFFNGKVKNIIKHYNIKYNLYIKL